MRKLLLVLSLVLLGCGVAAAPAFADNNVLDNHAVVEMVQLGLGQQVIEAKIHASTTHFDTSPEALAKLKRERVPSAIITAMINAGSGNVVTSSGSGGSQWAQANGARALFEFVDSNGADQPMSPVRVTSEISTRKAWIPFYHGGPETFLFIDGRHAALKTSTQPSFITNLDPISVRLVHLGQNNHREARYVVFNGSTTDREVPVTTTPAGTGTVRITPAEPLQPGEEYAFLVSPQLPAGIGYWAYFLQNAGAGRAYDFGVQ
ncbi:MAG: hypothetical protein ACREP2_01240 [Rhodanobacteraceae bacterium]